MKSAEQKTEKRCYTDVSSRRSSIVCSFFHSSKRVSRESNCRSSCLFFTAILFPVTTKARRKNTGRAFLIPVGFIFVL